MQDSTFKYDVFLSHSKHDKPVVLALAERLREDGLKVWLDDWVIQPGDPIGLKIEEGLQNSRVLILCMSQDAFDSEWVSLERHTIIFRDPTNKDRRFIPLLIEEGEIPLLLKQYAYLNWKNKNDEVYDKLLNSIKVKIDKPEPKADKNHLIRKLEGHTEYIDVVAVSKNGKQIVSGSSDYSLKVWDFDSGKELLSKSFDEKESPVGSIIFLDEKTVVSSSGDNDIIVWDLKSGENFSIEITIRI